MKYLEEVNYKTPEFGDLYDELPLWSAPFGQMLLEHVTLRRGMTILDVGAGTGFAIGDDADCRPTDGAGLGYCIANCS